MKLSSILMGLFLFIAPMVIGQNKSTEDILKHYSRFPREAIQDAEKMYREAIKEHNTPLLLKALIQKNAYLLEIDYSEYPLVLKELEDQIANEKDTLAKCILQSYTGELFSQYYNRNRYTIDQRTPLEGYTPEDITDWTGNLFKERVVHYLTRSLSPSALLQQTPVSRYKEILITGAASDSLRPTLYDFLSHRAIEILHHTAFSEPFLPNEKGLLADVNTFVGLSLPADSLNLSGQIMKIWQQLLAFRSAQPNTEALVVADLERLVYARQFYRQADADSLYLHTLRKMQKKYEQQPIVVEILAREASILMQNPFGYTVNREQEIHQEARHRQEAFELCQLGIRLYPKYSRINLLRDLLKTLTSPDLNARFPSLLYPGDSLTLKISSQNLSQITVQVHRIHAGMVTYLKTKKKGHIPSTKIYEQKVNLLSGINRRDTIIRIPHTKTGLYEISLIAPGAKRTVSAEVVCTRLFVNSRTTPRGQIYRVCDWKTGKPVKGAKILLYKSYPSYVLVDSLFTNAEGIANGNYSKDIYNYQVTDARNPDGYLYRVPTYYPIITEKTTTLITDRRIYRPGQIVYYQGIAWEATTDTLFPVTNKTFTIGFRNSNNKEISSAQKTSNSFGSFSGQFLIPNQALNGTYSLITQNGQTTITVAEYKRPEFEIVFFPPTQNYYSGDLVKVKGKIQSFSGIKLPDTPFEYQISLYTPSFWYPGMEKIIKGSAQTDAQGEFSLDFKAELPERALSFRRNYAYRIDIKVTDNKGESQEESTTVPIYSGQPEPVLQIPEYVNKNRSTAFRILLKDLAPDKQTQTVHYMLYKLASPPSLGSEIRDTLIEKTVFTGDLTVREEGSLRPSLKELPSGAYLFKVQCGDKQANQIFFLYSDQDSIPPVATYSWLPEKKIICRPGEIARVKFGTSVKDAYVMYEIFTVDRLIRRNFMILDDEITTIDIPYQAAYGKEIWLCITYIKDLHAIQEIVSIQRHSEDPALTIHTKTFRDKLQPGERETWEIQVTDSKHRPVDAEVLAMMYDASLDKLIPYRPSFAPHYLRPEFPFTWFTPMNTYNRNFLNISPWLFKRPNYPVPPFRFDRLQTYSFLSPMVENLADFGSFEEIAGSDIVVTGYGRARGAFQSKAVSNDISPLAALKEKQEESPTFPTQHLRRNFQETAFFYPQLQTDTAGIVTLKFTVPESTTQWKFSALAYTKRLATGQLTRYITTSKALMVRPNLPRFFRSGDQVEIKALVSNLSGQLQEGETWLELFTPDERKILVRQSSTFKIAADSNQTVSFRFKVPAGLDLAGCRIVAQSKNFSDGEQHLIPILPAEVLVTETLPFYMQNRGTQTYRIASPGSKGKAYRLTLELTANPIWYAVLALPSLQEPGSENTTDLIASYYVNTIASRIARANPRIIQAIHNWKANGSDTTTLLSKLEQNRELKSILLEASPWVMQAQTETERMQMLSQLFDQNRLNYLQEQALRKLAELQNPNGGWSWFKGMYPNRFITENVLAMMARATLGGEKEYGQREKEMQMKALRYLDREIIRDYENKPKKIGYEQIVYLHVRSLYRDIPLGEALTAHKYFIGLVKAQWANFSLYEKAIAATTLSRYGMPAEARSILESLRQYAKTTPDMGMFWPNNRNSGFRNSAVQIHTAIMEAFLEIEENEKEIEAMKQWLLRQKQTQSWENVPSTVDAIHALLLSGSDRLSQQEAIAVQMGREKFTTSSSNPLGYLKKTFDKEDIQPNMFDVKITKNEDTPSWGGIYLQYFESLDHIRSQGSGLQIDKKLYIEKSDPQGNATLIPLDTRPLQVGDKVIVRLSFSLDRDMEFLYLKDLRGACFEPVEQISGIHWKFGTVYYQEVKDATTNFFFQALAKGNYVIEYPVWVNQAGTFQDGIATFQSFYAPEFSAHSRARKVESL